MCAMVVSFVGVWDGVLVVEVATYKHVHDAGVEDHGRD